MSQYTKPSIMFLAAGTNTASTGSCFTKADMDLITSIIGPGVDSSTAFGMQEACAVQLPIDMYCKFTSAELGAVQAFIS